MPRADATVSEMLRAIRRLPADEPVVDPKKWYLTQKQHWIGWLGEYHTTGAYGRAVVVKRDARYAYNHIVEPKMLLWLIEAAGLPAATVKKASKLASLGKTMMQQSAAIRRLVSWDEIAGQLWPRGKE